ncbi:MAG: tRNA1(Val) (adenine(37)-N6)-methyltransferase [Nitrospirae bacterium]|nr:tRNA1(Val) (adenine(37)-N6)-methyltransferase [Nitrospirota bacterium]
MDITLDGIRNIKIYQSRKGYRFSIDALLLYSFVNLKHAKRIADLGAGSGVVGLLLAKKYPDSQVSLIELQRTLTGLAEKNIALNQLVEKVKVINCDIKKIKTVNRSLFTANYFDLVVSNPPFRRQKTGLISPTDEKAIARHEIKLKLEDLIETAYYLLRDKGRFCIIYHPSRLIELIEGLRRKKMEPKRLKFVHSDTGTEAKMVLVEAAKNGRPEIKIEKPLFIYNEDKSYTDEVKGLY